MDRDYQLRRNEPVPDGVRRIARARIDHALDELRRGSEKAVHESRKDMKKLRALLRLVRDELGDDVYRRENRCFRDAARSLAGARDAEVMLATLERLDGTFPALRAALEDHRRKAPVEDVTPVLNAARRRVDEWPLEQDGFNALEGGLRRIYRRGRRAWRTAESDPTSENLHEWRKRVKDLWYHLTLLCEGWPAVMTATADEAHELSDLLGDDHDLAVLAEWAHDRCTDDALAGLDDAVAARREQLQRNAFLFARRLYAEKPRAFARRLGAYWS